ncbi:MAG: hypothetical protein ACJ8EY_01240 [Sphingomicrobium sp.]
MEVEALELKAQPDDKSDQTRLDLIVLAIFVLGIAFLFGTNPKIFGDGDVSWHIAAGQWMIEHRQIPTTDPFSYTAFGKPWIAHEWLSEVVMAATFAIAGFGGIAILVALALSVTFLIIGLRLRRWMPPVETCATLMVVALVLYPFTLARPMTLLWPMLALWTESLLRARARGSLPSWWLVPLMTLWINLHASFALGILLAGAFGLEALIDSKERVRTFVHWALFGIALVGASLLNPHGLTGLLLPLGAFGSSTITLIREFNPTDFTTMPFFELAIMLMIGAGLWRGARLPLLRLLVILGMLHLALAHIRHQALFAIIAALVAAPGISRRWIEGKPERNDLLTDLGVKRGHKWLAICVATVALLTVSAARLVFPVSLPESDVNPVTAFNHIPPELRKQPVLNEYSLGGPLILRGIKVFMDGRTDVYGDAHFLNYVAISHGDPNAFALADRRWHFCWSIFPPGSMLALRHLNRSREWRRIYADKYAVIHVRRDCQPQG